MHILLLLSVVNCDKQRRRRKKHSHLCAHLLSHCLQLYFDAELADSLLAVVVQAHVAGERLSDVQVAD